MKKLLIINFNVWNMGILPLTWKSFWYANTSYVPSMCVWENNNHIKIQLISFPSVSGLKKLQSMLRKMCTSHPLFPLLKYIPFAPTRGLLSCKSIYTGESLFIDYKIRIIKSVKWTGISLTAGFKMVKIFIYRKYLKLILQVFMSPSESWLIELILITAGDNT